MGHLKSLCLGVRVASVFFVSGEKVIVNDPISSGSVQKFSIICFVPNSIEMKFWLEDI